MEGLSKRRALEDRTRNGTRRCGGGVAARVAWRTDESRKGGRPHGQLTGHNEGQQRVLRARVKGCTHRRLATTRQGAHRWMRIQDRSHADTVAAAARTAPLPRTRSLATRERTKEGSSMGHADSEKPPSTRYHEPTRDNGRTGHRAAPEGAGISNLTRGGGCFGTGARGGTTKKDGADGARPRGRPDQRAHRPWFRARAAAIFERGIRTGPMERDREVDRTKERTDLGSARARPRFSAEGSGR